MQPLVECTGVEEGGSVTTYFIIIWAAATKSDREMQHNRSHPPTNWWIQDGGWSLALEEHSSKWSCPLIDCKSVREWERKPSILHWNLNRVWQSQGNNSIGKWFANRMFSILRLSLSPHCHLICHSYMTIMNGDNINQVSAIISLDIQCWTATRTSNDRVMKIN